MKRIMRIPQRILSLALALVLVVGLLPVTAFAAAVSSTNDPYTVTLTAFSIDDGYSKAPDGFSKVNTVRIRQVTTQTDSSVQLGIIVTYYAAIKPTLSAIFYITLPQTACDEKAEWDFTNIKATYVNNKASFHVVRNAKSHTGGTATCMEKAVCSVCGNAYGDFGSHNWGDWTTENGTHTRVCTLNDEHVESGDCDNAPATCLAASACSFCGHVYEAKKDHNYTYNASGSTITEICTNGCNHSETAKLEYATGNGTYPYTGSEIKPLKVTTSSGWKGGTLSISYSANTTNVGAAKGVITKNGKTAELGYTITEANIANADVALEPTSGTYTGAHHNKPDYSLTYNGKPLALNTDYTAGEWSGNFLDAGAYTMELTGKGNFTGTKTITYNINKADPTAELFTVDLPVNPVYDGTTAFAATVTSDAPGLGEFTVKYDGSADAPTNAGTYKVTVDVAEGSNYNAATIELGSFTVAPTAGSISIPENQTLTYDGAPVEYIDLNPDITTDGDLTVTWYNSEGASMNNAPTNVGTYQVGISAADGNNYNAVGEVKQSFAITQKNLTITAKNQTITYGESIATGTAQVTAIGLAEGDALTAITLTTEDTNVTDKGTIIPSDAAIKDGETDVLSNYQITYNNGNLIINAKEMTAEKNGYTGTYDGEAHTITVTPSESDATVKYGTVEGTYDLDTAPTYTNAGTYTVYYEVTKDNYTTVRNSAVVKIDPVEVNVTVGAIADQPYTGNAITPVVTITPEEGKLVGEDTLVQGRDYTVSYSANTDVGEVTVTINDVTGGNYTVSGSGSFNIVKAENSWTTAPAISGWTYGESASSPNGAAKFGDVTVTYAEKGTENFTSDVPTQAGDYTAKFTVDATDNYNGLTETVDFTIAKKPVTVTEVTATGREYDGTKTVGITEVKLDGIKDGDTVTVDVSDLTGTLESADKGTYTAVTLPALTLSAGSDNYTLTQPTEAVKTNVEITAKPITVTVADITDQTWTGSALTPAEITPEGLAVETDEYCSVSYTDNTNVGKAIVKVEATGNYSFEAIEKTFLIVPDESLLDGLTTENVTSGDKTDVDKAVAMMDSADMNDAPEEDKEDWEALKNLANTLQDKLEAADAADETQNIQDAENINANNVKPDQKQELEDALKDLENARKTYSGNYTKEEKAALDADIKRIEDALAAIERVEDFNTAIDDSLLTGNVKTDMNAATEQAIKDAQKAYNALSDHEKTLIDPNDKAKLDTLVATITAYKITKGDGGRYTVDSGKTLSFTANGPVRKFDYVQVNGKTIASSNYTVTEGSTVITLKSSYLDKLGYGKHKIQIFYTDGSTNVANFRIYVNGGNPFTGDDPNMLLLGGVAMISLLCMAMMIVFIPRKKGKYER